MLKGHFCFYLSESGDCLGSLKGDKWVFSISNAAGQTALCSRNFVYHHPKSRGGWSALFSRKTICFRREMKAWWTDSSSTLINETEKQAAADAAVLWIRNMEARRKWRDKGGDKPGVPTAGGQGAALNYSCCFTHSHFRSHKHMNLSRTCEELIIIEVLINDAT